MIAVTIYQFAMLVILWLTTFVCALGLTFWLANRNLLSGASAQQLVLISITITPVIFIAISVVALSTTTGLVGASLTLATLALFSVNMLRKHAFTSTVYQGIALRLSSETKIHKVLLSLVVGVIAIWAGLLITDATLIAVTQNDALEYFTVANLVTDHKSLSVYPAVNPDIIHSRGFFGPWTHPPSYVASLSMLNMLQGGASDVPGLMRIMAPLCLIGAATGIASIALRHSTSAALLSTMILLSMPLLTLGAGSSLIDPMAALACSLVLLGLVFTNRDSHGFIFIVGISSGLAAWSHSQAILFIPIIAGTVFIMLLKAQKGLLYSFKTTFGVVFIAIVVACTPYIKNYFLFGSPVSDNPAIFAMPELSWESYIRISRGYVDSIDILQYGLFKGWFVLEAYGFAFWIMLIGCVQYIWSCLKKKSGNFSVVTDAVIDSVALPALLVIVIYLTGVALSIILKMDLMIKNERYLLLIAPAVSLLAGLSLSAMFSVAKTADSKILAISANSIAFLSIFACLAIAIYTTQYRLGHLVWSFKPAFLISSNAKSLLADSNKITTQEQKSAAQSVQEKLIHASLISKQNPRVIADKTMQEAIRYDENMPFMQRSLLNWPNTWLAANLNNFTNDSALILSMRPADMYYARSRKMISYLDPRLVQAYRAATASECIYLLKQLGISHIVVPDYSLPTYYATRISDILRDPKLSKLIVDAEGNQLYELSSSDLKFGSTTDMVGSDKFWTISRSWELASRKSLLFLESRPSLEVGSPEAKDLGLPVFKRNLSISMISGLYVDDIMMFPEYSTPVKSNTEYLLTLELSGKSFARIAVEQFNQLGFPERGWKAMSGRSIRLFEIPVNNTADTPYKIQRRFMSTSNAQHINLNISFRGSGGLQVHSAKLQSLEK